VRAEFDREVRGGDGGVGGRGGARGAFLSSRPRRDPGQDANGAEPTGSPGETDTVVSEPARDRDTPEEPDEYASAPGRVDRP